jgi:hypothetical protein
MDIRSSKGVPITGPSIKLTRHSHTPQRRWSDSYWSFGPVINNLTDLTLLPPPSSHDHDETMTTWQPSLTSSLPIGYGNVWLILATFGSHVFNFFVS